MKTRTTILLATAVLVTVACSNDSSNPIEVPDPTPTPKTIDGVLAPMFEADGLEVVEAGDAELCRRLSADLLGRFVTADQVESECAGKTPTQIATAFQSTDDYVRHSVRTWRDRFDTSDARLNYRHLKPMYELVAQLHRDELPYDEFAIEILADPGFLLQETDVVDRASRVHEVFLGKLPTTAIANDLASLVRIWEAGQDSDGAVGVIVDTVRAFVVPGRCGPLGRCETTLLEGGVIDFEASGPFPFVRVRYENLTESQIDSLRGLGRLIVAQPGFWEAQADAILDRLLGWNDGGSVPRRPGTLLPMVRSLVAEHLAETGSVASAERLVIESILYRQTGRNDVLRAAGQTPDERPIWATGPVKYTSSEVVLATAGLPGTCDPRFPDGEAFANLFIGLDVGGVSGTNLYEQAFAKLIEFTENWTPIVLQERIVAEQPVMISALDTTFSDTARLFGGCPGVAHTRGDGADGLTYAYGNELAVNEVCERVADPDETRDLGAIVDDTISRFLGRGATSPEQDAFALAACADCDPPTLAQNVCIAVLGSHEMLLY